MFYNMSFILLPQNQFLSHSDWIENTYLEAMHDDRIFVVVARCLFYILDCSEVLAHFALNHNNLPLFTITRHTTVLGTPHAARVCLRF